MTQLREIALLARIRQHFDRSKGLTLSKDEVRVLAEILAMGTKLESWKRTLQDAKDGRFLKENL